MRESVTITTEDGVRLAGHFYPVNAPKGWALLLHMMPATKESYAGLATALQERDIASLAIDFRGHGESEGGPKGYEQFTDAEQQAKIRDVHVAHQWLQRRGQAQLSTRDEASGSVLLFTPPEHITDHLVIVGASIGANLALQYTSTPSGKAIRAAVLLSPGLDYRGIATEPLAERVESNRSVFLAAGGTDDGYSTATVQKLAKILGDRATVRAFSNAGHGTTMFDREPRFLTEVADWVAARAQ